MGETYITRSEHDEFCRRLDIENDRQNTRIKELEETTKQINSLTVSVEKLAVNMESMLREISAQGNRLKTLESRDGEMWRKVVGFALSALVGGVIGFMLFGLGMGG